MNGPMVGKWPGEVASYDAAARTCRVRIPGVTDGSNVLPEAVFEYPIGDRADAANAKDRTEIRVLAGDLVWLEFECGDPRFPIITGYRTKRAGNPTNWRRWHHANVEMTADGDMVFNAQNVIFNVTGNETRNVGGASTTTVGGAMSTKAATSTHEAATHKLTAQTTLAGSLSAGAGPGGAGMALTGGALTHNGVNVGSTHTHTERGDGAEVSPPH
jgi:hypothetical protein